MQAFLLPGRTPALLSGVYLLLFLYSSCQDPAFVSDPSQVHDQTSTEPTPHDPAAPTLEQTENDRLDGLDPALSQENPMEVPATGSGQVPGGASALTISCTDQSGDALCQVFLEGERFDPASGWILSLEELAPKSLPMEWDEDLGLLTISPGDIDLDTARVILTARRGEDVLDLTARLPLHASTNGEMVVVVEDPVVDPTLPPLTIGDDIQPSEDPPPIEMVQGPCTEGKRLSIWLDSNDDGEREGEPLLGYITTYQGPTTAAANYNYSSASAHPLIGPPTTNFESKVFFFDGTDGLALTMFHNTENDNDKQNAVLWNVTVRGNNLRDAVLQSDDANVRAIGRYQGPEFRLLSTDQAHATKLYIGDWKYQSNTDGGVLGPFEGEDFTIAVRIDQTGNLTNATFFSANGQTFQLKDATRNISSFIIAYAGEQTCP
ncbi:MAG: hypothetical protein A2284_10365 [Deltaproteobacteria bacterium RIFOXYA12_FULL_61_11]|nr:MAG: hypothetical protein A2284_10365 [Deltaproteobacteria bacterium RIFOXYA12_FULL_61_11]